MVAGHADEVLAEARTAYGRHEWQAARDGFEEAEGDGGLAAVDVERLSWACRWLEDPDEFADLLERAEAAYAAEGDPLGAARMALEQARHHKQMLRDAVATTSYLRALEHLDGQPESAEEAQALWALAFTQMESADFDGARAGLERAQGIAHRVGAEGVEAMAVQGLAHLAVATGARDEAVGLMDRAAALAMRQNVEPIHAGHVYCAVISACRALCDWRRASEWTEVSERYCARESISGYSGLCRFHQAEIDRLHGLLARAEERVEQACEELLRVNRMAAGWGFSELVEIRVRRGDLDGAEDALARAVELGSDGQPGRARLLLARGAPQAAVRSLERTLADNGLLALEHRVFMLPAHVTASLAVDDVDSARRSIVALEALVARLATDAPAAAAAVSRGELALHCGDVAAAAIELGAGIRGWCEVGAPYETAQARVLLARALREDGDRDGALLELKAARRTFTDIGAAGELARLADRPSVGTRALRTFMFSDIVGSTRLAEALGDEAWEPLLTWHDRTLRSIFALHAGEEVKHGGDGFLVAFTDPDTAVDCAAAIQQALAEHRAAHGFAPSVRIGLHAGEATARDGDYFGSAVTRASRITDATGAAEVLASTDLLARCARPHPVGERRTLDLKGIEEPIGVGVLAWGEAARPTEPSSGGW